MVRPRSPERASLADLVIFDGESSVEVIVSHTHTHSRTHMPCFISILKLSKVTLRNALSHGIAGLVAGQHAQVAVDCIEESEDAANL